MQIDIIDENNSTKLKQSSSAPNWNRKLMDNIILKLTNIKKWLIRGGVQQNPPVEEGSNNNQH